MIPLLYTIPEYEYLGDELVGSGRVQAGRVESRIFPDGEEYHRIEDEVRGKPVAILGGTVSDKATLQIFDLACALVKYGASQLTFILPYFGYSTMERATRPGEVIKAKTRARLLSAVPIARQGNEALLLDLHSEGIPHYFEGAIAARHVYASEVVLKLIRELGGEDFVLGATDAGRAKWVQSYANELGVRPAFILKRRRSDTETSVEASSGHVSGKRVVLYDDMIRTGGSLLAAARAYREAGAVDVRAVTTHGVFARNSLDQILADGAIAQVAATNSHPNSTLMPPGSRIGSVAGVLLDALFSGEVSS